MADPHNEVIVLCLLVDGPLILPDNLVTTCSACGRQVRANADALTVAGVLDDGRSHRVRSLARPR
jgi:hypothetical protein